jgi:hypothetical protein
VSAGQDVAVAIMRCGPDSSSNPADKDGFLFRLTVGLRKLMATGALRMNITRYLRQTSSSLAAELITARLVMAKSGRMRARHAPSMSRVCVSPMRAVWR